LLSCSTIVRTSSHGNAIPSCPSRCHQVWVVFWALAGYRSEELVEDHCNACHRRPKVGNYVSSYCTGTNYYYSVYIKYLNMNTQVATIPSGNCTSCRPEQLRPVLSCHSLGVLLSILCRAMLSCFCLGLLLPPFHNYFWNV